MLKYFKSRGYFKPILCYLFREIVKISTSSIHDLMAHFGHDFAHRIFNTQIQNTGG